MNNRNSAVLGLIFILLGIAFLIGNLFGMRFDIFDVGFFFSHFWPLFIIIPGIAFHTAYFSGKNRDAGVLVPGGILLTIGIVCQISMLFGIWGAMWPGFILAVAVGLFELYLFGSRDKGLLIPVGILGGLALFSYMFTLPTLVSHNLRPFLLPGFLIILGLSIFLKHRPKSEF
jgi:hypothetical protein